MQRITPLALSTMHSLPPGRQCRVLLVLRHITLPTMFLKQQQQQPVEADFVDCQSTPRAGGPVAGTTFYTYVADLRATVRKHIEKKRVSFPTWDSAGTAA